MKNTLFIIGIVFCSMISAAQCPNNNTYYETVSAPTSVGNSVTTYLYGGEFTTVTGMIAGRVYQISTCGDNAFDSQITIYKSGNNNLEAYNDDYSTCSPQSRIYYSPLMNGSYNVLMDEYDCSSNSIPIACTITMYDTINPVITIPTVVHIIYNNSTQNISNSQIQSQIDVLNEDFRRLNSDITSAPARFRGFSKDSRIEFCLASMDPNGDPTTGITRTSTTVTSFSVNGNDEMKFTSMGGKDAWPRNDYLNIWVVNLSGTTLGYAQFPGQGAAATDGVVIDYEYFGTIGTVTPPFDLGRTATHEVGHWLNLYHIWGDDGTACNGTDGIEDTPNQGGSSSGCPSSPPVSCSNSSLGGDMYVNYLDYSDDDCMSMFTYWQYREMEATLYSSRSSLQNSDGCSTGNPPVANFSANQTSGAPGLSVNFSDLSTGNPSSWSWTFQGGSPSTSSQQNPTGITFNSVGSYSVTLTATNGWGNDSETKTGYITIGNPPIADFSADVTSGPAPLTVNFTDLSTNNPNTWSWTFPGAGTASSNIQNPSSITYQTAGVYSVSLTATNNFGNSNNTKTDYIVVDFPTGIGSFDEHNDLKIFPNPNSGGFSISLTSDKSEMIDIEIYDLTGRLSYSTNSQLTMGFNTLDVLSPKLSNGVYSIHIKTDSFNQFTKLIIEH